MKLGRVLLLVGIVVPLASARLAATAVDPVIKTGGGMGSVAITSPVFSILSPSGTSPGSSDCVLIQGDTSTPAPSCLFENEIIQNQMDPAITQISFVVNDASFSGGLTCGTSTSFGVGPFSECSVTPIGDPSMLVTFFGGSIPFEGDFSFEFDTFNMNTTFGGTASVPEPSTLALFLGGIGALVAARRRSRAR